MCIPSNTYTVICFSIDPNEQPKTKGMYINDGWTKEKRNLKPKVLQNPQTGRPHICFFATEDVEVGAELRYDYGDHNLPWRKVCTISFSYMQHYIIVFGSETLY